MQGAREIAFAVVAMTLTLAAVFAPLAFATGRTGRLFIEFALTLAGAVMVSGLRRADADADDVLAAAAPRAEALVGLQPDRGGLRRPSPAATAALLTARAARALDRRRRVAGRRWASALLLFVNLKSELAPIEDRGVVFGHRDRAARARRRSTRRARCKPIEEIYRPGARGLRLHRDLGLPDGRRRQRDPAAQALGGTDTQAAADRRRAAAEVRDDPRRAGVPDQPAVAGPELPLDADRVRDHGAGALRRAAAAGRPLPRRGPQVPGAAEPRRPTCGSTSRSCGSTSTATSSATSASTSTPSAARSRRCSAAGRSRASSATASSTTSSSRSAPLDRALAGRHQRRSTCAAATARWSSSPTSSRSRKAWRRSAQPLQAAARGHDHRQPRARLHARRGAEGLRRGGARSRCRASAQTELDGQSREFRESGSEHLLRLRAGAVLHLPGAGGAVRELRRPFVIMLTVPLSMTGALFALLARPAAR